MTTPNEELIARLRDRATFLGPELTIAILPEAADLLQSQAERIAGLEKLERALKEGLALACIERDALRAELAALANAERVEPDTQRLNWLGQNFYRRENLDFITGRPSKTHTMWVFFAPIKVQGDIRRVLDAAKDE